MLVVHRVRVNLNRNTASGYGQKFRFTFAHAVSASMAGKVRTTGKLNPVMISRAQEVYANRAERCQKLAERLLSCHLSEPDMDILATLANEHPTIGAYLKGLLVAATSAELYEVPPVANWVAADAPGLLELLQEDEESGLHAYLFAHAAAVEGEEIETEEETDEAVVPD
jgi:hypothetical protein